MGEGFNQKIIRKVVEYARQTKSLKERSPYYPLLLIEEEPDMDSQGYHFVASTLIRKKWKGKWYTIHLVARQSSMVEDKELREELTKGILYRRIMLEAYNVQQLYIVTGKHEDLDSLQIAEKKRLMDLIPKRKT